MLETNFGEYFQKVSRKKKNIQKMKAMVFGSMISRIALRKTPSSSSSSMRKVKSPLFSPRNKGTKLGRNTSFKKSSTQLLDTSYDFGSGRKKGKKKEISRRNNSLFKKDPNSFGFKK